MILTHETLQRLGACSDAKDVYENEYFTSWNALLNDDTFMGVALWNKTANCLSEGLVNTSSPRINMDTGGYDIVLNGNNKLYNDNQVNWAFRPSISGTGGGNLR